MDISEAVGQDLDETVIIIADCHYYELYPDICVGGWPDLDCIEIKQRDFTVIQPDPYGFDLNKDGIGCERKYYK